MKFGHFKPAITRFFTVVSASEPSHYPVPADPSAVGDVGAPALHRLLLSLLRIPLDQVRISQQAGLTHACLFPSTPHISFPPLQFFLCLISLSFCSAPTFCFLLSLSMHCYSGQVVIETSM